MKKIFFLAVTACLLLSSCIHFTEELFLEKNGSGSYVATVELNKLLEMSEMVKQFSPGDSSVNMSIVSGSLMDSLKTSLGDLSGIKGISDVRTERVDSGTYKISFRFANMDALNEAMKKRQKDKSLSAYSFSKKDFSYNSSSLSENMGSLSQLGDVMGELGNSDTSMNVNGEKVNIKEALGMIKLLDMSPRFKTIYHFPSEVKEFSNKNAKLSEDKKTLSIELDLLEAPKGFDLSNKVKLR